MPLEEFEGVIPGLASMNHDGPFAFGGDSHLLNEDGALHFTRGVVVMIVKANFSHGDHAGMREYFSQTFQSLGVRFRSIVRMHSSGCREARIFFSEADAGFQIRRALPRANRE